MQEHWENIGEEFHNFKESLEGLIDLLPQSAKISKQLNILQKNWGKLQRAVNAMDPFITPVKSIDVKSPLLSDIEFKSTWQLWKEYLVEQHGIHMRSRTEMMALKRMMDISEEKPSLAVFYLEYAMYRCSQNFFKVNETDLPDSKKQEVGNKIPRPSMLTNKEEKPVAPPKPIFKQKNILEEIKEFKREKRSKKQ